MKLLFLLNHCVKYVEMWVFSDPYFSVFGKIRIHISMFKDRIINCNQSAVTETSQLQRSASQLTGFYMISVFTARYFRTDYNYFFTLNVVIFVNFKHIQITRKEV